MSESYDDESSYETSSNYSSNDEEEQQYTQPEYATKQLKPTGFGDVVKMGADVPREHIPQPVDPNAHLGEMYAAHASAKFKQTGFGYKLKQGQDVPRDHIPPPEDPNKNLGKVYASVELKKSDRNLNVGTKESESTEETITAKLQAVKLHKTSPPVEEKKKEEVKRFELPEEFAIAQQNLKHRSDSPWYTNGVADSPPSKKWWFLRGEWSPFPNKNKQEGQPAANNKKNAPPTTTTTTIFRGSNTTVTTNANFNTHKNNSELSIPLMSHNNKTRGTKKKKNPLQPFDKKYYEEIQRRRQGQYYEEMQRRRSQGLPPKPSKKRSTLARFCLVLSLLVTLAAVYMFSVHPEVSQSWLEQHVPPHVCSKLQTLHARITEQLSQRLEDANLWKEKVAKPYVNARMKDAHPYATNMIHRICNPIENFTIPQQHQFWLTPFHAAAMYLCETSRAQLLLLDMHNVSEYDDSSSESFSSANVGTGTDNEDSSVRFKHDDESTAASSLKGVTDTDNNTEENCACNHQHNNKKPNLFQMLFSKILRRQLLNNNCCHDSSKITTTTTRASWWKKLFRKHNSKNPALLPEQEQEQSTMTIISSADEDVAASIHKT